VVRRAPSRLGLPAALALVLLAGACATVPDPRRMTFDPPPWSEPEVTRVDLDNGLALYLLPDRSLPLIRLRALVRTGLVYAPPDRIDAWRLAGKLMREGGAGDLDADAFDDALDFAAIEMASNVAAESASATVNTLTRNFPLALARFADMLRRPRFQPDRIETRKAKELERVRRRDDNPGGIVRRVFRKAVYGLDHPLAHDPTEADIEGVTRDQMVAFHQAHFHPNRILLGITGDFEVDEMVAAIEGAFGDWAPAEVTLPEPPPIPPAGPRAVWIVHKPVDQVPIRIGAPSLKRDDPDYYPLLMANDILGGGAFMSRLFQEIRTREGLAYSVGSGLRPGLRDVGTFQMATRTRSAETGEVVGRMLAQVERLRDEPVPSAELEAARDARLNAFVFRSTTSQQAVYRLMRWDYFHLPVEDLETIRARFEAVTAESLQRAVRAHLDPDRMVIVAVGDRDVLTPALRPFGVVREVTPQGLAVDTGG
jgi:zinc protease